MPMYCFVCSSKKCGKYFETLEKHDPTGEYKGVTCPYCNGKRKKQSIGQIHILGPTSSKMDNFEYRAGYNMEKAKECRRKAEAVSHMGDTPYTPLDDTPLDIGIHDNEMPIML